jgi:hypothetical protein
MIVAGYFEYIILSITTYFSNTLSYLINFKLIDLILPYDRFTILIAGSFAWTCLYIIVHNLPINHNRGLRQTLDTKNRIVSIIHASVLFLLSLYDYLYNHRDNCGSPNTTFQNNILLFFTSYFIYDILASIYFNILDSGMLYHHLFVIFSMYAGLLFNNSAEEMIRAMISAEISNPIMHIKKILSNAGLKDTKIHLLLEYIYFALYISARMIFGMMITWFTVVCMNNLLIVKIGGSGVIFQSLLYSLNMSSILKIRAKERKERESKRVELYWFEFNPQITELDYFKKAKGDKYVP